MAKEQSAMWILGHYIEPLESSGDYEIVQGLTPVGVAGPPSHSHSGYSEQFIILEGSAEFIVNGETHKVGAGQAIDLPANTTHTFSNAGSGPCRWINIHSPKGFFAFFKRFGIPDSKKDAARLSVTPEIIGEVLKTAIKYDMRIVNNPVN